MNTKHKNIIISISFISLLLGLMIINIIVKDKDISYNERRKLKQLPKFTVERVLNGEYFKDFEKYSLDQFVFRDDFRFFKAFTTFKIFKEKDNKDIYIIDDNIYKMEYPLNEKSVYNAANIYNKLSSTYFNNSNIYYTIIPDKNYFVPKDKGYLSIDYNKMIEIMKNNTKNMKYIDISKNLNISHYYKIDIHWKQEEIIPVADKLLTFMGNDKKTSDYKYEYNKLSDFYGSYYGQSAMKLKSDNLTYLTNEIINNCKVYDYEKYKYIDVYNKDDFNNVDSYDIYLGGAKPLLQIENPNSNNEKELYVFRDSFGSSMAPLLISEYSKIVLIDLRYISFSELEKYIKPKENSDVLFMYNTLILNDSSTISR